MVGTTELLLLGGLALLLFGGKKVPEMMRGLGEGVKEFKKGMKEDATPSKEDDHQQESEADDINSELEMSSAEDQQPNNGEGTK